MSSAKRSNPKLWDKVVSEAKASSKGGDPGEWSARKAQMAVAEYKKRGGGYEGPKQSDNSLAKWTKEKWRTSDNSPSEGKKRYLPDKAWSSLSSAEKAATNAAKAKGNAAGKQFVAQPKSIAEKTAKFRKNSK
jgi:hypothetical protein